MLAVDTYNLVYTSQLKHQHLISAVNARIMGNAISSTENAQLAEYLLRQLKFDAATQAKAGSYQVGENRVSAMRLADYITHIHQVKSEEIRSRFQPEISEEQASDILYKMELESRLDEALKDAGGVVEVKL